MSVMDELIFKSMPTGRYAFALSEMESRVKEVGKPELEEAVDDAADAARTALSTEFTWASIRSAKSTARGNATLIDNKIDRQVAAIFGSVENDLVGDDDDPVVKSAEIVMKEVFPEGVGAITLREYEVQLGIMDSMMERFRGDLAEHVERLHLERHIARLSRLMEEFRQELATRDGPEVTFDKVRAARTALHEATCHVIVAAHFLLKDDDEARIHFMAPLNHQRRRVAEARRRHRVVTDIDPDTGEEVEPSGEILDAEEEEPTPEPAPTPQPTA